MKKKISMILMLFILVLGVGFNLAQDNKKSAKEKEKKEEYKEWTDEDIKRMKKSGEQFYITEAPEPPPAENTAANSTSGNQDDNKNLKPQQTPKYWQQRKMAILFSIAKTKGLIQRCEEEMGRLYYEYDFRRITQNDHDRIVEQYDKLYQAQNNYKSGLVKLQQELEDLNDEARQAGIPPGWLRIDDEVDMVKIAEVIDQEIAALLNDTSVPTQDQPTVTNPTPQEKPGETPKKPGKESGDQPKKEKEKEEKQS